MRSASQAVFLAVFVVGCAGANTAYRGVPVSALSDEQLVTELHSAAVGYGVQVDRTAYLMTVRPEPAYVLTSSTTQLVASAQGTYNAFVMPAGYGAAVSGHSSTNMQGSSITRYQYTDVNASARLGNAIATAISRSREGAYRKRALEVIAEYRSRVTIRRAETERTIQEFFAENPDLDARRPLVTVVAPWAAAEGRTGPDILRRTKEIISTLPRGEGLTGEWYGAFSQTTTAQSGEKLTFSEFVRITLEQKGSVLTGRGKLGSGELLELIGTVSGQDVSATVANTTSAINVRMTALATPSQMTGSFSGAGAGARMEGMFTLIR